ncbi:MAG: type II toxin-antitoxin system RelE/ParE family toxin [Terriglobales bacterium]
MSARYVLSPEAEDDLASIWEYLSLESNSDVADHVANVILEKVAFLAENPGAGHSRADLTDKPVNFFPVY